MKLAEALQMRKQLAQKVEQLKPIKVHGDNGLFETKTKRIAAADGYDDLTAEVAKVELKDITKEFDLYARALRKIDSAIQQANWQFDIADVDVPDAVK